jgi:glycosyltransferase involved in cell wall biosynthesis
MGICPPLARLVFMKLLHIIAQMNPQLGGVCQAVRTITAGLEGLAVHSEVVSLDAADATFLVEESLCIHALGPAKGPWQYSAQLLPWLLANLPRFDVVILHGLWLYQGYAVRKALAHCRRQAPNEQAPRLYVMPHGMLDPYFQRAASRQLKAWRNWAYWKLIEGQVVNEATGVLFTCEAERQLAPQAFRPYRPQHTAVIGLGVSTPPGYVPSMHEAFLAACPSLRNKPYLLFLGRIHEKKGVDLLLHAYAALAAEAASPTAELPALVIVGPGLETSYGQLVKRMAAGMSTVDKNVFLVDMLTGEAKWGAFYGCEAFVLPSHQENFGIAVVEALACGKPVLISNQVNIWQEIVAAGAGLVADDTPAGTYHLLAEWNRRSMAEKQAAGERAQIAYEHYFAVTPAAQKMKAALH